MSTPSLVFARGVLHELDQDIAAVSRALLAGQCSDIASYRELVGKLRGLEQAREHIVVSLGEAATPELKRRPSE